MRLREGDKVKVVAGKDKGKTSRIVKVFPTKNRIIVENVNTAKKHMRPQGQQMQGGIIDKDMPIDASNVMILCEKCGPTRIAHAFNKKGEKYRTCAKCGGAL